MSSITFTLKGRSGTTYKFTSYGLGTKFRPLGAVYVVTKRSVNLRSGTGYSQDALYVGQTGDLSTRFVDHHKESAWKKRGATHINILTNSSERDRLQIEKDLIDGNNPCCNG